ncbi:forkhead associated domain containing protein [Plasmodium cynomolgi strain B]|uniref:E3 ubiquitin-protein ligase CHFR n=1 Tax=Plasmodium cynomolgi (strain B) TaxID=1120755 RepID=K6UEF6_PLACD|nr:forkhead associated domain containing protein [Plasmodium cynomolgi strain B]GAB68266.1 forkhead associated domain containing protein [Plasmodium cynomolgi strain B]
MNESNNRGRTRQRRSNNNGINNSGINNNGINNNGINNNGINNNGINNNGINNNGINNNGINNNGINNNGINNNGINNNGINNSGINNNGINIEDSENNNFIVNDDGMFIDDNDSLEDECITPKDDEDNINSRRKRTDRLNNNENKNMASERGASNNGSGSLGRGLNNPHAQQQAHEQYGNRHPEGSNSSVLINGAPSEGALPDSGLPSSNLPNSGLPNSGLPNSDFPDGTTQSVTGNIRNGLFVFNGDNILGGYDGTGSSSMRSVNQGLLDGVAASVALNVGASGASSIGANIAGGISTNLAANVHESEGRKNDPLSHILGGERDNVFVNGSSNYFVQNGVHAESNHADEVRDARNDAMEQQQQEEEEEEEEEQQEEEQQQQQQHHQQQRQEEPNPYEELNRENHANALMQGVAQLSEVRARENIKKKDDEMERNILHMGESDPLNDELVVASILNNENQLESGSHGIGVQGSAVALPTGGLTVESFIQCLKRELTCPICLDYFYLPVTMNCGHTFCRYCIGHNKLNGKNCPLCRQALGHTVCINTIISNLVRIYNLRRKSIKVYKSIEIVNTVDEIWWNENFIKPQVSVPLFLRIFLNDMISVPVFFDDLTACIVDFFTVNNLWSKAKWVFNINDCKLFSELIGYDKENKEVTNDRLHAWVENYITQNPSMCIRKDEKIILKIIQDRTHKIDSQFFDSSALPNRLPWDGGRHVKSLIHMPHSSVSLSHLIFVKAENNNIGVVDCGSTIGTMIKVNNNHVLKEGDIIHIGDRLEVTVSIDKNTAGMPYKGYVWDKKSNKVLDRHELNELMKEKGKEEGDEAERERGGAIRENEDDAEQREESGPESRVDPSVERLQERIPEQGAERGADAQDPANNVGEDSMPSHCENIESNLLIKFDFGTVKDEVTLKTEYIDPKGVVLGRGPYAQSSYKKLSVTNSNGYVSREHCLIYYDGTKPVGERWLLRDTSTLGTFLKIPPFSEPVPLPVGSIFKAGQCKIEVCSRDSAQFAQHPARSISLLNANNRPNTGPPNTGPPNPDDGRNNDNGSGNGSGNGNGNGNGNPNNQNNSGGGQGSGSGSGEGNERGNGRQRQRQRRAGNNHNNGRNNYRNQASLGVGGIGHNFVLARCGEIGEPSSNDSSSLESLGGYNFGGQYYQQHVPDEHNGEGEGGEGEGEGGGGYLIFNGSALRNDRSGRGPYNVANSSGNFANRMTMTRSNHDGSGGGNSARMNARGAHQRQHQNPIQQYQQHQQHQQRQRQQQHHQHNRDTYFYNYLQHRVHRQGNDESVSNGNDVNENSDNENGNNGFPNGGINNARNNDNANGASGPSGANGTSGASGSQSTGHHGSGSSTTNRYNGHMSRHYGRQANRDGYDRANRCVHGNNLLHEMITVNAERSLMNKEKGYYNAPLGRSLVDVINEDVVSLRHVPHASHNGSMYYVHGVERINPVVCSAPIEGENIFCIDSFNSCQGIRVHHVEESSPNHNQHSSLDQSHELNGRGDEEVEDPNEESHQNEESFQNGDSNEHGPCVSMGAVNQPQRSDDAIVPYENFCSTSNCERNMSMNPHKKSNKGSDDVVDARNGLVYWSPVSEGCWNVVNEKDFIGNNVSSDVAHGACGRKENHCEEESLYKKRHHGETFMYNSLSTVEEEEVEEEVEEERGNSLTEGDSLKGGAQMNEQGESNIQGEEDHCGVGCDTSRDTSSDSSRDATRDTNCEGDVSTKNINTTAAQAGIFNEIEPLKLIYDYIHDLETTEIGNSDINQRVICEENEEMMDLLNSSNVKTKKISSLSIYPMVHHLPLNHSEHRKTDEDPLEGKEKTKRVLYTERYNSCEYNGMLPSIKMSN